VTTVKGKHGSIKIRFASRHIDTRYIISNEYSYAYTEHPIQQERPCGTNKLVEEIGSLRRRRLCGGLRFRGWLSLSGWLGLGGRFGLGSGGLCLRSSLGFGSGARLWL